MAFHSDAQFKLNLIKCIHYSNVVLVIEGIGKNTKKLKYQKKKWILNMCWEKTDWQKKVKKGIGRSEIRTHNLQIMS